MRIIRRKAEKIKKHGIDIWVYKTRRKEAGMVYVEVKKGHFQEFYDKKSTFLYYIIQGEGTFFLNSKKVSVQATDLVVVPPLAKIYYFGSMKMILVTVPAWKPENEVHVRFIDKKRS